MVRKEEVIYQFANIFLALIFFSFSAHARFSCSVGDQSNSGTAIQFDLDRSSPLLNQFRKSQAIAKNNNQCFICGQSRPQVNMATASDLSALSKGVLTSLPKVKSSCIEASLKMSTGSQAYGCTTPTSEAKKLKTDQICYSNEMIEFLTWAFNQAVDCLSDNEINLDPFLIYKKISNESLFHFNVASNGGKGLGQLSTSAVDAMNKEGVEIFNQILYSNKLSCSYFKRSLIGRPKSLKNYCGVLHYSEGVAANLLYSIGYMKHIRKTRMKDVNQLLKGMKIYDQRFHNLVALSMYGPDPAGAKAVSIRGINLSGKKYDRFLIYMKNHNAYIKSTFDKYENSKLVTKSNSPALSNCFN